MDDTLHCPICNARLRTVNREHRHLSIINKIGNWAERTCHGMNHTLQIFTDHETNKVDLLTISLDLKNSRILMIDYLNQKCQIRCWKDGQPTYIDIAKMIEPDFPDLVKLKERVALYVVFS